MYRQLWDCAWPYFPIIKRETCKHLNPLSMQCYFYLGQSQVKLMLNVTENIMQLLINLEITLEARCINKCQHDLFAIHFDTNWCSIRCSRFLQWTINLVSSAFRHTSKRFTLFFGHLGFQGRHESFDKRSLADTWESNDHHVEIGNGIASRSRRHSVYK